jgi:hypothetical protein
MKKWISLLLLAAGLTSCIYPYKPDIEVEPEPTLVVDGHILVGGISTIRLSYLTPIVGEVNKNPRGKAWIEDDRGNQYTVPPLAQDGLDGYSYDSTFLTNTFNIDTPASPGASQYRAVVEVDGETYTSAWITPDPAPVVDGIHFRADDRKVYVVADLKPGVKNTGYAGFLLEETWEFHADVFPEEFIDPETWEYYDPESEYPYYWCFRSVSLNGSVLLDYTSLSGEVIREIPVRNFLRTDARNHRRYSILVKAFALSKEAYDYNRQTQEMSELGGDLFSPDPGALEGNLVCESHPDKEVMGYVQAGYVSSRRAFMTNEFLIPVIPTIDYVQVPKEEMPVYYYDMNFRPVVKRAFGDGVVDVGWAAHRCINCLEAGGTQVKPDFWDAPEEREYY